MAKKSRKLHECNYCGHKWFGKRTTKKCPECKNPVGKKPKHNVKYGGGKK